MDSVFSEVTKFLENEYSELIIDSRKKFVGCKFGKSDRFYIFYISYLYGRFTLTYRTNVNNSNVIREKIDEENISFLITRIKSILNENIINKPLKVVSKNKKRSKNNKLAKYRDYVILYKNIKLYEFNLQPTFYNYLVSEGLVSVVDFLLYDFNFNQEDKVLEEKVNRLRKFLLSSSDYSIFNYKFLLKSSFKDKFSNEDYERYIDFALCIGNLTFDLVSKFNDERNASIFFDYIGINFKSKQTFRELGEKYDISFGRVRDIVNRIINKLKLYKGEYVLIFDMLEENDILNYFIVGILSIYNVHFLKMFLDIINLDIYDSVYYRTKFFLEEAKNTKYASSVNVNESKMLSLMRFSISVKKSNTLFYRSLSKMRSVDRFSDFTGEIRLKKTRGFVEYESLTEKRILNMLDSCEFVKSIKTQSLVIPFQNFREDFEYYPDIQVLTKDNKLIIIEVKPLIFMMEKASIFKFNLLREYALKNNFAYAFIDDRYNSFDDILNREVSNELEVSFIDFVKNKRYVDYEEYKNFKKSYRCSLSDIVSIVIRNSQVIEFTVRPFKFRYRYAKKKEENPLNIS